MLDILIDETDDNNRRQQTKGHLGPARAGQLIVKKKVVAML